MLSRKEIENKVRGRPKTGQRHEIPANGQGLFVVVQASGTLSWAMRYQGKDGKHRKVTLGRVDLSVKPDPSVKPAIGGHLSPDAAQRLWTKLRNNIANDVDIAPRRNDPLTTDLSFATQARLFVQAWLRKKKGNKTWQSQAATLGWDFSGDEPVLIEKGDKYASDGLAKKWQHKRVTDIKKADLKGVID